MKRLFSLIAKAVIVVQSCRTSHSIPLWSDVCTQEDVLSMDFCNSTLDLETRVADYVNRIPVHDQINMMNHNAEGYEPLHIPPYQWWSEGLHGPMEDCVQYKDQCACPTSFPCPSGLANAFNTSLYYKIGEAIGREGRAINNLKKHDMKLGDGLTYWSPTINMQRDPRWGRNQEVPGEDPHLTSQYAKAFVSGLQGDGDKIRIAAACKHFVANSLEAWGTVSRHSFDAHISKEDLYNYYLPPFQECAKHALGVMCAYNALNGIPACTNSWLLDEVLRQNWNFSGYIVSDCGALEDIVKGHHYAIDPIQASAMALNASVDVNCGPSGEYYPKGLLKALEEGWVKDSKVRESFARLARIQFRLGLFDSKEKSDLDNDFSVIDSHEHQQLALDAALQSIVLLKNKGDILPLNIDSIQTLAVIGPHSYAKEALLSNYHGSRCGCTSNPTWDCIETPYDAFAKMGNYSILGVKACNIEDNETDEIDKAVDYANNADAVILIVGLDESQEMEGLDRNRTTLPGLQPQLIQSVLETAAEKTVLVLIHGGSISLGSDIISKTQAIISASYGGQGASEALAKVIFGLYNPTGKLAATWYPPTYVDEIPMTEMGLKIGVGRTHLYYKGNTEFPFGHGLSYSRWELEWEEDSIVQIHVFDPGGRNKTVSLSLYNQGPYEGSQNVLLFWRPLSTRNIRQKLIAFQDVEMLRVGEKKILTFQVEVNDFGLWSEEDGKMVVVPGMYQLEVLTSNVKIKRSVHLVGTTLRYPITSTIE